MADNSGAERRRGPGRPFRKGMSGNPGGRAKALAEVQALAQQFTAEALEGLAAIARNGRAPAAARVAAWNMLLDRAWGKPMQPTELHATDDRPVYQVIIS